MTKYNQWDKFYIYLNTPVSDFDPINVEKLPNDKQKQMYEILFNLTLQYKKRDELLSVIREKAFLHKQAKDNKHPFDITLEDYILTNIPEV